MSNTDYENRRAVLTGKICGLLYSLGPSTYDEIAPKIEFWIGQVLDERFMTAADLANRVSSVAWDGRGSKSHISRFLKEFRDAPHRSEQARSFVGELCSSVLQWFWIASSEDLWTGWHGGLVSKNGGPGFIRAASFVGHLIEGGLVDHELVRRNILKPLTAHYYDPNNPSMQGARSHAIYWLFVTAGNTLLQGLLEPEEVQDCLERAAAGLSFGNPSGVERLDTAKINEFREIHAQWLQRREEEGQRNATTPEVPVPVEVDTPVAFVPQNLPSTHIGVDDPSSAPESIASLSILRDVEFFSETLIDSGVSTASSPTLSISTISDLTPTELGEDNVKDISEPIFARHETFYLEDGNVEIMCGHTIFRVHSPIVSFASPKLRDMLSQSTLLGAPMPEGCPRIDFDDSAEDFAVLMKMIYTPGFPTWPEVPEFAVFASLLRMTTKYNFSHVRRQLLRSLEGAYPTTLKAYQAAEVPGEDVFGLPKPHPNAVLNLFLEQKIGFAIPLASYRAALGGLPSLLSNDPGATLPRLALAFTVHGMDTIRIGASQFAHSIVCNIGLKGLHGEGCVINGGANSLDQRLEELNRIYKGLIKEGKGDVLSSFSFSSAVCMNCQTAGLEGYDRLCAAIWENLPRFFKVGRSWEEIQPVTRSV